MVIISDVIADVVTSTYLGANASTKANWSKSKEWLVSTTD